VIIRVFRLTIQPGKEQEFETFLGDTAVPLVSRSHPAALPPPAPSERLAITDDASPFALRSTCNRQSRAMRRLLQRTEE